MRRFVGSARTFVFLAILILGLGACGDDDDMKGTGGSGGEGAAGGAGGTGGSGGTGGTGGTGGVGGTGGTGGVGGEGGTGGDGGTGGGGGECVDDLDCPLDAPACVDGSCTPCTANLACQGRGFCDTSTGSCVECVDGEDWQCPEGVVCQDNICVECNTGSDCPTGVCADFKCQPPLPCGAGGTCGAGFACVDSVNECWPECPYGDPDPGCIGDTVCTPLRGEAGRIVAVCLPNGGEGQEGERCGREEDPICSFELLCIPEAGGSFCRNTCDPDAGEDACPGALVCDEFLLGGVPIHFCRNPVVECATSADCESDEHCEFNVCTPTVSPGNLGPGAACTDDDQCITGTCLNLGVCSGSCVEEADCAEGSGCIEVTFTVDGGSSFPAPICAPTCDSDADCDTSTYCGTFLNFQEDGLVRSCLGQRVGAMGAGQSCTSSAQCRSGSCIGEPNGYCRGVCTDSDDCGPLTQCSEVGLVHGDTGDPLGSANLCTGQDCTRQSDCPTGWSCRFAVDPDGSLLTRCEPPVGSLPGGATCTAPGDCQSGWCIMEDGEAWCMEICATDADCDSGTCLEDLAVFTGTLVEFYRACAP